VSCRDGEVQLGLDVVQLDFDVPDFRADVGAPGGRGDLQGAKDAFQKAIDSGHPNAASAATAGLGMLADQGA
jgi:hypothetical protein